MKGLEHQVLWEQQSSSNCCCTATHQLLQKWVYAKARTGVFLRKALQGTSSPPSATVASGCRATPSSLAAVSGSVSRMRPWTCSNQMAQATPA